MRRAPYRCATTAEIYTCMLRSLWLQPTIPALYKTLSRHQVVAKKDLLVSPAVKMPLPGRVVVKRIFGAKNFVSDGPGGPNVGLRVVEAAEDAWNEENNSFFIGSHGSWSISNGFSSSNLQTERKGLVKSTHNKRLQLA